jgi:hypothetical protein
VLFAVGHTLPFAGVLGLHVGKRRPRARRADQADDPQR